MAIYDYLPKFHQIEANNLKALQPGFVVSQMPFKSGDELLKGKFNVVGSADDNAGHMVANGHIVTISKDGLCTPAAATDPLFITYNDPIVKVGPRGHYAFYATDIDEECVRAVQLIPGDEWMSDIDLLSETYPGHDVLAGRIEKVEAGSGLGDSDDWFSMKTLADGTAAFHYVFIK